MARGTFYLDGHKPDDDKRTYILPKDQLAVPPYQIPLRSLISRDGLHWILEHTIVNFTGFAPLGTVLVSLLGIGIGF